ncbi:DNase I-like protein [Patellaria atrata CBS 101060]|uniref:DNase I-like protein n=1 Tax=Patellaria atrata CBS 101060 TaxID=1346257 RepID=A0A9P4VJ74_9PEZI|nr:DNase I-like protein [Patellaria atrata CBS 101060]
MGSFYEEAPTQINIFTLNCWGLKYIAKHRNARLAEIGNQIAVANPIPEIVGLQECWTQEDYLAIRESTRKILPYGKFYYSGIFGGGLAILSKWPIEESTMVRYPLNGRPAAFYRGDWFVGKGVACARIRIGRERKDVVEVFCTHLHAPYESEPYDSYLCHRTAQAWEIAKLMRHAAERGHLVIGLGDFNMRPLSLAHRLIEAHSPVKDVWRILHPDSSVGAAKDAVEKSRGKPIPSADYNLTVNGATCDSALNTWRWNKGHQKRLDKGHNIVVEHSVEDPKAKRLDYIFFANPETDSPNATPQWAVTSATVGMTGRHPTLHCSLSDHFSVEATLTLQPPSSTKIMNRNLSAQTTVPPDGTISTSPLPLETYDSILTLTQAYTLRERHQRILRLAHMGWQLCLSIGCLTGIWWAPYPGVGFLLALLSTVGLSVGVIDGLMGGLFVGSELRALKEFEWEIMRAREDAERVGRENWARDEEGKGALGGFIEVIS